MKEFVKMTLATMAGLFIFGIVAFFFMFAMLGAVAAMGEKQPVMPRLKPLPEVNRDCCL